MRMCAAVVVFLLLAIGYTFIDMAEAIAEIVGGSDGQDAQLPKV